MSKFKTSIPVDVDTIKNNLPPKSFVNGVTFTGNAVVIEWENDDFKTPYTYAVEWQSPEKIPAGVVDVKNAPPSKPSRPVAPAPLKMHAPASGQQTTSPSADKTKPNDAAAVKKKPAAK